METLLENIDDLLAVATIAASPLPPSATESCLVAAAHADGTVFFEEDSRGDRKTLRLDALVEELARQLADAPTCTAAIPCGGGSRLALGMRLTPDWPGTFVVCLKEQFDGEASAVGAMAVAAEICGALVGAASRCKSHETELLARTEQLIAGQEALLASCSRNVSETIAEHEARLREREAAEEALRRLHAYTKLILDSAGEGIIGLDGRGHVMFANPAAERMLAREAAEMVGQALEHLVRPDNRKGGRHGEEWAVCRTLREGLVQYDRQEVFRRKDDSTFPVEYMATPMREGHEIVGAVVTFQDITERCILEGQLIQAQKLESIGQLAAGIAHEINTPTQFIGDNLRFLSDAFAELGPFLAALRRASEPRPATSDATGSCADVAGSHNQSDLDFLIEEIPTAISQALEGVERVAKIVRSMKEFSHPGTDVMQPVDVNKALESTLTVCRNEWKYIADVVTDFDETLPPVNCLPAECNQVFLNLIINAAHAVADKQAAGGPQKGVITVSTRRDGDWAEIRISDTGTGIAEAHRTKVFDPFFTTKPVGRGTGQGLAIARSVVVDKHKGTLSFETEMGKGTTFIVRLPCRAAAPAETRKKP